MRKIKKAYYYMFYKFYNFYERDNYFRWVSDFKAGISLIALEIWIIASLFNYYNFFLDIELDISENIYIAITLFFVILNYLAFIHTNIWKKYNEEFDQLPKEENRKGGIIVWGITALIIVNLIFSYYLLYIQAKKNQIGPYAPEVVAKERRADSLQKAKQIEKLKRIYGEEK